MHCRYAPLGCSFLSYEPTDLIQHEHVDHTDLVCTEAVFRMLGDYRRLQFQMLDRAPSPEVDVKESKDSKDIESANTVSVPYRCDDRLRIRAVEMRVLADSSDLDTFPDFLVDHDCQWTDRPAAFAHFLPLKYPSVVIENGIHNSLLMVRIEVEGDLDEKCIHFGLMNARGTYLRRMIPQSRHSLDTVSTIHDTSVLPDCEDPLFRVMCYRQTDSHQFEVYLQFRDIPNHMFEGHYRDLRVLLLSMSEDMSIITSYDAATVFRVSPNKHYVPEKRVSAVVQELKWDVGEWWHQWPEVPPMLGVNPTMRVELTPLVQHKRIKRKPVLCM